MVAPAITRRARPAFVMGAGLVVAAIGLVVMSRVPDTGIAGLVTGSLIFSLGLAPMITLGTDLIVGAAPPERAGRRQPFPRPARSSAAPWASRSSAASGRRSIAETWPPLR